MLELGELGPLVHLVITTFLVILYAKKRAVVTLPALMLTSLVGVMLGLPVHPFILGISSFAAALIVFIAGLELDPEFLRVEKERVLVVFAFEAVQVLTIFYILNMLFSTALAATIVAIMVASNEAFVVELNKYGGGRLAQFGITLSVLEDALAVFLLSVGFFTTPKVLGAGAFEFLITMSIFLVPLLFLLSRPFSHLINSIERRDARILLAVLYLSILIALGEFLGIPEAIPVFIGAVFLSYWGFSRDTFHAMESYFVLALMGFVSSLPYTVYKATGVGLTLESLLPAISLGAGLAFAAYILRMTVIFTSSLMGGLSIEDALSLSLVLANTGEFGLIVLASLVTTSGMVPSGIAYAAMFAYAFNLTFVSEIALRLFSVRSLLLRLIPSRLYRILGVISSEANKIIESASADVELKRSIVEIGVTVVIVYAAIGAYSVYKHPITNYVLMLLLMSAFLAAVQEVFQRLTEALRRVGSSQTLFAFLLRLMILYVVIAPLLHFINEFYTSGKASAVIYPLDSPISLFSVIFLTLIVKTAAERLANALFEERPQQGAPG